MTPAKMIETSVIIPTFNRLTFLTRAIASVQEQTCQAFELIVIDDGSTDGTREFVRRMGTDIRYLYQERQGPSAARNRGIRAARGRFISFLDSDDLWLRNKLATQIDFMHRNREAIVCYSDEIWIRRGVRVNQKQRHRKMSGWIFEHCVPLCIVSPSSVLMRRAFFDVVGMFDEQLPSCEDYDLWLRASVQMPFFYIAEQLIVKHGGHADQLSAHWGLDRYRVQSMLKLLSGHRQLNRAQTALLRHTIIRKCEILAKGFAKRGNDVRAEMYLAIATEMLQAIAQEDRCEGGSGTSHS
jgi:glycosyltransferase involved in cell wall biosynthesis